MAKTHYSLQDVANKLNVPYLLVAISADALDVGEEQGFTDNDIALLRQYINEESRHVQRVTDANTVDKKFLDDIMKKVRQVIEISGEAVEPACDREFLSGFLDMLRFDHRFTKRIFAECAEVSGTAPNGLPDGWQQVEPDRLRHKHPNFKVVAEKNFHGQVLYAYGLDIKTLAEDCSYVDNVV